jgi:hypothetical protein
MWIIFLPCTTSRGVSSVQGSAGREGKNIYKSNHQIQKNPSMFLDSKNVDSKFRIWDAWKLFDNVLSKVFGAVRARSLVPVQLRQQATFFEQRNPDREMFWSRRKRKTTEVLG